MRTRTYAILIACLLALCEPGVAGATGNDRVLAAVQSCLTRLQSTAHKLRPSAPVILSERCPALSLSLENPRLAQLEPALLDITTVRQLKHVQRSLQTWHTRQTTSKAPDIANLNRILGQVYHPEKQVKPKQNLFDKVMHWIGSKIQDFLKRHHWITDNFHIDRKTGIALLKGVLSTVLVLLVALVIYIIVTELRAAGGISLFRRRRYRRGSSDTAPLPGSPDEADDINKIKTLPLNQQAPLLLQYTLHQLIEKKLLPRRYSLTNREFAGLLRKRTQNGGEDFEQLVNNSDRIVYGKQAVTEADTARLYTCVINLEKLPAGDSN